MEKGNNGLEESEDMKKRMREVVRREIENKTDSDQSVGTGVEEKIKDSVNGRLQEWKTERDEEAKSFKEIL